MNTGGDYLGNQFSHIRMRTYPVALVYVREDPTISTKPMAVAPATTEKRKTVL